MDSKLVILQASLTHRFGFKVDVYRQQGRGVLAVRHGDPLTPKNVIFSMNEFLLKTL